jgi:N utilization substance protein B
MFNRRFLRIKVFQELYAFYQDEKSSLSGHEKVLLKSLDKTYNLYLFLLAFPAEFKFYLGKELDVQTSKHFPDGNIITPLKTLIRNQAIPKLEQNEYLNEKVKSLPAKWTEADDLFKNVLALLRESEMLKTYLGKPEHTFNEDRKMLIGMFEILIGESELFDPYIEDAFINWEDDQVLVTLAIFKTIQALREVDGHDKVARFEPHRSDDFEFMKDLFRNTIQQEEELVRLIAARTKNWEADRIAAVDMLLMKMALCEILTFPHIPVKVSINEYLELAKLYSTPNSHGFINGVLDKIHLDLKAKHKIVKTGRGLVE